MIDRAALKREAKAAIRGKKPSVFLVTIVYIVIGWILGTLAMKLMYPGGGLMQMANGYLYQDIDEIMNSLSAYAVNDSFLGWLLNVALGIMETLVAFGFSFFCLKISRGVKGEYADLFEGFGLILKVILLNIVMGIFITLWTMLFIIPGIVAAYRYSMAMYILMDEPDMGIMDCIRESKRITQGYKGKLFVLDLSFIGWAILSAIPFVSIYTYPYMEVTKANYYKVLSGRYSFDCSFGNEENSHTQDREPWDN